MDKLPVIVLKQPNKVITAKGGGGGGPPKKDYEMLTASRTYYVRKDGNDSNNGLSDTAAGAFLTIQAAIDYVNGNLRLPGPTVQAYVDESGIVSITIKVADGVYAENVTCKPVYAGTVKLIGNLADPSAVTIQGVSPDNFCVSVIGATNHYVLRGFHADNSASYGYSVIGCFDGGTIIWDSLHFTTGGGYLVACENAVIRTIYDDTFPNCVVHSTTDFNGFVYCSARGYIDFEVAVMELLSPVAINPSRGYGVLCLDMAEVIWYVPTIIGAATGPRFYAGGLAFISVYGMGLDAIPGDAPGTAQTALGGFYG